MLKRLQLITKNQPGVLAQDIAIHMVGVWNLIHGPVKSDRDASGSPPL